jgi:hypothetical protein
MIDFKTLQVWQKAHRFTLLVYNASQSFPKEELLWINQSDKACFSIYSLKYR